MCFRLAYTLKQPLHEVFKWSQIERDMWGDFFDLYGPLDWRRQDLLNAQLCAYQSTESKPIKDFTLFAEPDINEIGKTAEDRLFEAFGINTEDYDNG